MVMIGPGDKPDFEKEEKTGYAKYSEKNLEIINRINQDQIDALKPSQEDETSIFSGNYEEFSKRNLSSVNAINQSQINQFDSDESDGDETSLEEQG